MRLRFAQHEEEQQRPQSDYPLVKTWQNVGPLDLTVHLWYNSDLQRFFTDDPFDFENIWVAEVEIPDEGPLGMPRYRKPDVKWYLMGTDVETYGYPDIDGIPWKVFEEMEDFIVSRDPTWRGTHDDTA